MQVAKCTLSPVLEKPKSVLSSKVIFVSGSSGKFPVATTRAFDRGSGARLLSPPRATRNGK